MHSLYWAAETQGGIPYWRRQYPHLRLRSDQRNGGPWWTDERIRRELARLCDGRREFPTKGAFLSINRSGLYRAVTATGGVERWAAETGLPLSARSRPHRPNRGA
jgi:hypothetical protein